MALPDSPVVPEADPVAVEMPESSVADVGDASKLASAPVFSSDTASAPSAVSLAAGVWIVPTDSAPTASCVIVDAVFVSATAAGSDASPAGLPSAPGSAPATDFAAADFLAAAREAVAVEVDLRAREVLLAADFFAGCSFAESSASVVDAAADVVAVVLDAAFGAAFFAARFLAGVFAAESAAESSAVRGSADVAAVLLASSGVVALPFAPAPAPAAAVLRGVAFAAVFFAAVPVFFAAGPAFFAAEPAFFAAVPDVAPDAALLVARVLVFLAAAFAGVFFAAPLPASAVAESVVLEAEWLSGSADWLMCRSLGWRLTPAHGWGSAPGRRAGRSAAG
ncbi:hypothetical protein [Nocardia cyriacigeorgica]|uniref:hypothetical protein n=1 Tax=Nocardia cyriacigeorgica TaxID=135487 RepID=UPI002491B3C5|nr:hypothetical protein [Nocardia cyriacigeorgica]